MPSNYPRAPVPLLAILLAPFTWQYGRPDLFDSYRFILPSLLSLATPQLPALLVSSGDVGRHRSRPDLFDSYRSPSFHSCC